MGMRLRRESTRTDKKISQAEQDLLDTQELAAQLFEQNQKLQENLLDTQELLATMAEKGGVL